MINWYGNKIANEVLINNLHLIPEQIQKLSEICIEEDNKGNTKACTLYVKISNKTKKIKFEILSFMDIVGSTNSIERFGIYTMYGSWQYNGYSEKDLNKVIENVINQFKDSCKS